MNRLMLSAITALFIQVPIFANEPHHEQPHNQKPHSETNHEVHWDYDSHGPSHWGEFGKMCPIGHMQSPIDIITKDTKKVKSPIKLTIHESSPSKVMVLDNGHAIEVKADNGGTLKLGNHEYKLVQFHFHGRSEEMIDGKRAELVAHMVHKDAHGKLLVIAVLFDEGEKTNKTMQTILDSVGKETTIKPADILPKDTKRYYKFMGSLTTPPCSEGVQWIVFKDRQIVSKSQIEALRKYYDHNYRPIQPTYGRLIESI